MKKIVPFNNVLKLNTDVSEITAISLEHDIKTESDLISGSFYITGEYKITDGQLDRESFSFELPFDIALSNEYKEGTLVIDIDDFRYELIDRDKLKVNIDLFIDGEIVEVVMPRDTRCLDMDMDVEPLDKDEDTSEVVEEEIVPERIELLKEMLTDKEDDYVNDKSINIENVNNNEEENKNEFINIFNGVNEEEKYVTYRVYRVMEGDTIDKILDKYKVSKEELGNYNDITNINVGDKLIIPAYDK